MPFNAPFVLADIAKNEGAEVCRYSFSDGDYPVQVQSVIDGCAFLTDGLFAAVKLLWTVSDTGKSVARLSKELPDFYVSRKIADSPFDRSDFCRECEKNGIKVENGAAILNYEHGRVLVTPSRTERKIHILSEAANYEFSKEICSLTGERFGNLSIDTDDK